MKDKTVFRIEILIFIAVFFFMLVFNVLTPVISDDYAFAFTPSGERLSSFSQIFPSLVFHRQNTNGRVFSHFLVYLFSLLPRPIFWFFNAANTTFVIYLLFRFTKEKKYVNNIIFLLLFTFSIWIFTPEYGSVFLGLTGACNYSWGLSLYLLFIYPYYCVLISKKCLFLNRDIFFKIIFIIVSFISGAYSENGAVSAIVVATCSILYLLIIKKRQVPVLLYIAIIAEILGFAFMMLSPSELHGRTSEFSIGSIIYNITTCFQMTKDYCLWLFIIYSVLLVVSILSNCRSEIISYSVFLILGGVASIAVFAFAAYLPTRSFYILSVYMSLSSVLLCKELWSIRRKEIPAILCAVLSVIFIFEFALGAEDILSISLQNRARVQILLNAADSSPHYRSVDVIIDPLISNTKYPAVMHELLAGPDSWYNDCIASYYGVRSVTSSEFKKSE